jgi:hypothetical protein
MIEPRPAQAWPGARVNTAFAAASLLPVGVTAGASYIPSVLAARSDPMATLRQE